MNSKIKLTYEYNGDTITFDLNPDTTCHELVDMLYRFLIAVTFQPKSITDSFRDVAENYDPTPREECAE